MRFILGGMFVALFMPGLCSWAVSTQYTNIWCCFGFSECIQYVWGVAVLLAAFWSRWYVEGGMYASLGKMGLGREERVVVVLGL